MKKVTVLSHPIQIQTIQLDDLAFDTTDDDTNDKKVRMQVRKWRRLRHGMA